MSRKCKGCGKLRCPDCVVLSTSTDIIYKKDTVLDRKMLLSAAKLYRTLGYNLGIVSPATKALVSKTKFYQVIPSIAVTDDTAVITTIENGNLKVLFLTLDKEVHSG